MCDQTEVAYLPDDIVWVKLGSVWWPAQVQDQETLSESVTSGLRKKPLAVVKFFEEDSYEFVRNLDRIYHYNCLKKDEFIRKGLDLCRAGSSRDVPSNMRMFPKDIIIAEKLTGGDPTIIDDPRFLPEKKYDYHHLFETKKTKKFSKRSPRTPRTPQSNSSFSPDIASPGETRVITHPRIIQKAITGKSDYESKIRLQVTPPRDESEIKNYSCQSCGFRTTRINVLILHSKNHMEPPHVNAIPLRNDGGGPSNNQAQPPPAASSSSSPSKTPVLTKPKKDKTSTLKRKAEDESPKFAKRNQDAPSTPSQSTASPSNESFQKTPNRRRGAKSKEEKAAVLKRKNEAIRETLLKDWDEEDPDEEEEEIERLKLNNSDGSIFENQDTPQSQEPSTAALPPVQKPQELEAPPKEKSCFDFEDNEESINPNESMKFGQKLPRVIGDEKPKKPSEERNTLKQDLPEKETKDLEILNKEFKHVLDETKVPEIPCLPKNCLPSVQTQFKESEEDKRSGGKTEDYIIDDEDLSDETQIVEQEIIVFDDSDSTTEQLLKDDGADYTLTTSNAFPENGSVVLDKNSTSESALKKVPVPPGTGDLQKEEGGKLVEERAGDLLNNKLINEVISQERANNCNKNKEIGDQVIQAKEKGENSKVVAYDSTISADSKDETKNIPQSNPSTNILETLDSKAELKENTVDTKSSELVKVSSETKEKNVAPLQFRKDTHCGLKVVVPPASVEQPPPEEADDRGPNLTIGTVCTLSSREMIMSSSPMNGTQDMQQMELDINSMPIVIEEDLIARNDSTPVSQNVSKIKIQLRKVGSETETESGQRVITIPGARRPPAILAPVAQQSNNSKSALTSIKKSQPKLSPTKIKSLPSLIPQKGPGGASQLVILKKPPSPGPSKFTVGKSQVQKPTQMISQVLAPAVVNQSQVLTSSQIVTSHPNKVYLVPQASIATSQLLKVTQQKPLAVKAAPGTCIITNKAQVLSQSGQKSSGSVIATSKGGQTVLLNKNAGIITAKNVILSKQQSVKQPQSVLSSKGVKSITVSKPMAGSTSLVVTNLPNVTKPGTSNQKLQLVSSKTPTKLVMQGKSKIVTSSQPQIKVVPTKGQTSTVFIKTSQGLFTATQSSDNVISQPIRSNQISLVGNQNPPKKQTPAKLRQITPNILQRSKRKTNARATPKQQFINIPSTTIQPNDMILPANNVPVLSQSVTPSTQAEPLKMVYLTLDEHGNYHPVNDQSVLSFNTKTSENALFINTGTTDGEKLFLVDQSGSVVDIIQSAPTNTCTTTTSQDILAKALANTQVLQSETTDISSNFDTPIFVNQQYPAPTLSHNVLETSLTLNQPIMTPLEVPSSVSPSGLSQISTAYLPVSPVVGEKQKSIEIQPSMPLLTDELEVPAQTVFLSSNNIQDTSGSQLTLQLTINDNMVVSPTPVSVQSHYQEATTSLSPSGLTRDTLVIPASKISQGTENSPVVSHLVLSPNFNISTKDHVYEQKTLENVLQTGLNVQSSGIRSENVDIHIVRSDNDFLNTSEPDHINESKFYSDSNNQFEAGKCELPPGSEFLNSSSATTVENKENKLSPESTSVTLKLNESSNNEKSEAVKSQTSANSLNEKMILTSDTADEEKKECEAANLDLKLDQIESNDPSRPPEEKAISIEVNSKLEATPQCDVKNDNCGNIGTNQGVEIETTIDETELNTEAERADLLNLPEEPIETETVDESEIYSVNSNDMIISVEEKEMESYDDQNAGDETIQKNDFKEESRKWMVMDSQQYDQEKVSSHKQMFYNETAILEEERTSDSKIIKIIKYATKESDKKDSVTEEQVLISSEVDTGDLDTEKQAQHDDSVRLKRPGDLLTPTEPTLKRLRGEDER